MGGDLTSFRDYDLLLGIKSDLSKFKDDNNDDYLLNELDQILEDNTNIENEFLENGVEK